MKIRQNAYVNIFNTFVRQIVYHLFIRVIYQYLYGLAFAYGLSECLALVLLLFAFRFVTVGGRDSPHNFAICTILIQTTHCHTPGCGFHY